MQINVKGGTNAGWKVEHAARTEPWVCSDCGHENKPVYRNCFSCCNRRPASGK